MINVRLRINWWWKNSLSKFLRFLFLCLCLSLALLIVQMVIRGKQRGHYYTKNRDKKSLKYENIFTVLRNVCASVCKNRFVEYIKIKAIANNNNNNKYFFFRSSSQTGFPLLFEDGDVGSESNCLKNS